MKRKSTSIPLKNIAPAHTDRVCFIGQTGCGKTTLAEYLLRFRRNVVVYDVKAQLDWQGYSIFTTLDECMAADPVKHRRIIYQPNEHTEMDNPEYWEAFFYWIYKRQNCTVYVDEVYSVTQGQKIPKWYRACLTRGRSRNIEVWSATQRPASIPSFILSESEEFYIFLLTLFSDRDKLEKMVSIDESELAPESLPKHQFRFVNNNNLTNRISGKLKLEI